MSENMITVDYRIGEDEDGEFEFLNYTYLNAIRNLATSLTVKNYLLDII